jgi:hypothetical protein
MKTDNFRSVRLHFVLMGWGDAQRMEYDRHIPIVLIQLALASLRNRRGFPVSVRRS